MPRIRTIKPEFFTSEDVSALPLRARLTWIGMWTHCDDHGRTKDAVRLIKAAVWPLDDVSLADVEDDLVTLAAGGRIVRYEVDGKGLLAVVNWHVHQKISNPSKARFPAPPRPVNPTDPEAQGYCKECASESPGTFPEPSVRIHGGLREASENPPGGFTLGKEGKGKEGDARGAEPSPRCAQHLTDRDPPRCGACADARRAHDAWLRTEKARPTPVPSRPHCPLHPQHEAGSKTCPECASTAAPPPSGGLRRAMRREAS